MVSSGEELCKALNIEYDALLEPYFKKGCALYLERGDFACNKDRLLSFNEKYNFIRRRMDVILKAADEVKKDENLMLFVYTLVAIYEDKKTPTFWDGTKNVVMMGTPDRQRLDTDFAPIFASFYFLERMIEEYERRGLPFDIISDTLWGMEKEIDDYETMMGRPGMRRYVGWYLNWVNMVLITIGRFQFKIKSFDSHVRVYEKNGDYKILADGVMMHKKGMMLGSAGQTDEENAYMSEITEDDGAVAGYASNEYGECVPEKVVLRGYREVLRFGDMVIDVHIPADLPLTPDVCKASYERAKEVLPRCYPEHDFKGIVCVSWMLEKRLEGIIGRQTNVTRFMDMYHGFPTKSSGSAVYSFVFKIPAPLPIDELAENTSMQKAVKKYLADGNYFYEKGGFMPL